MTDNKQTENTTVEAAEDDDADFNLGQFRAKTKDLPDFTPIVISAIIPTDDEDDEDDDSSSDESDSGSDTVESADDDDDDGDEVVTAPVLGVEIEDYETAGENGAPATSTKAIAIVMHIDDVLGDDDDEEDDEPVDNA